MRTFFSYGPLRKTQHYYVPRTELIDFGIEQLRGEPYEEGGHYITIWAPRQRGKSWIMANVLWELQKDERFDVVNLSLQTLTDEDDTNYVLQALAKDIYHQLGMNQPNINGRRDFESLFAKGTLKKPLILIVDEFDSLPPKVIGHVVRIFRNMYNLRYQSSLPTEQKPYLLHGIALIGVQAVLGVDTMSGSPFNVQRSMHIPNLTYEEVNSMFHWYERESEQIVEQEVIDRLFHVLQGQPGLTGWFGELLTETYNKHNPTITMKDFDLVYKTALQALPNANVMNIVSKAKQEPHRETVLKLFDTDEPLHFEYENLSTQFLYLNGVIDEELGEENKRFMKFPSQFVQERLFAYFSHMLYQDINRLYDPFMDLSPYISDTTLNIKGVLQLYEQYVHKNKGWLFRDAPRRKTDFRIMEATYHFNLFMYLSKFLRRHGGQVTPEFPTGNGEVDLIVRYGGRVYAIEVKNFSGAYELKKGIKQAAKYGKKLCLTEIILAMFVENIPDDFRQKHEVIEIDTKTSVTVEVVFVDVIQPNVLNKK
ncbi:MAG: hypothetical protein B6242_09835 [Anaerolineaceae bacterium 4572_78]|nr:MAG: hypothetical protein B6242_09835 [Anaerolineaceae bacterium 4572_78]